MKTIPSSIFHFLEDLKNNNNREWFKSNKPRYENAKDDFEHFIDELIRSIAVFDPTVAHHAAKNCVFRIYRDIRFSKDKSPYKVNFGANITGAAKKSELHSRAGYYIHLEPNKSFLAGGAYLPKGPWLKAIRKAIDEYAGELKNILNSKDFKKYFGEIEGEKLKTSPRGYPVDHPEIDLLRYKSFLAVHHVEDRQVLAGDFLHHCTQVFEALFPFDNFLNEAIQ